MIQKCEVFIFTYHDGVFYFLLLHRRPERGDYWQPITGSQEESDETITDTAIRETAEEAGVNSSTVTSLLPDIYRFSFTHTTEKETVTYDEHCFGFEVPFDTPIMLEQNHCNEHDEWRWFSYARARAMLKWEDNRKALDALYQKLTKH